MRPVTLARFRQNGVYDGVMFRPAHFALPAFALALSACAPTMMGAPAGMAPPMSTTFQAQDFAWSQTPGRNSIVGRLAYQQGTSRFTCSGASVILTPETPWSRHRMSVLYTSAERAAQPVDAVRARTPQAPAGDSSAFIKRATCDTTDRFSFSGLPDGAWYVIAIAKPADNAGASMALMRRVVTRNGRVTTVEL